jgi:aromatic-L-amino-acid decarboxylase
MNLHELESHLIETLEVLVRHTESGQPVLRSNDPSRVHQLLTETLPTQGISYTSLLADFEKEIIPSINQNTSPLFGAYITGSGNRVAALAEFIKAFYNQNGLKWNNSPIASELEQLVIRWVAEFCGLPAHSRGFLTSGGSMSNLMGIHLALASRYPEREMDGLKNAPTFTIYCSDQTHSSVDRAMVFLGLGRTNLRKIAVNERFEIRPDELRKVILSDMDKGLTPLMVIGNAGTTNTGSTDDLNTLATIAEEFHLWFHVDGAYGLPARRLPDLAHVFAGVERADSVIINPHKWMYVPFEASCVLLKEIPQAIHFSPDYLYTENPGTRWESSAHTIELSKEFRALKIWFTIKYFGADQLTDFVRHDIDLIDYLAECLSRIPHVEVEPHHPLSILCFSYQNEALSTTENEAINVRAVRKIESDGTIFITATKLYGKTYLRVYFGNPERTRKDVEQLAAVIQDTFMASLR